MVHKLPALPTQQHPRQDMSPTHVPTQTILSTLPMRFGRSQPSWTDRLCQPWAVLAYLLRCSYLRQGYWR